MSSPTTRQTLTLAGYSPDSSNAQLLFLALLTAATVAALAIAISAITELAPRSYFERPVVYTPTHAARAAGEPVREPLMLAPLRAEAGPAASRAVAVVPSVQASPAPSGDQVAQAVVALVNEDRHRHGLAPVRLDGDTGVAAVANTRAATQIVGSTPAAAPSHYDSAGQLVLPVLLAEAGVVYTRAGENLGLFEAADAALAQRAHRAFMASPTHRRVILEPAFDRLAVGVAADPHGRVALAQVFR